MKTISALKETSTSCGNVLRGTILVEGKQYTVEASLDKSVIWIIDHETSLQNSFEWDAEIRIFVPSSLNGVTDSWKPEDIDSIDGICTA